MIQRIPLIVLLALVALGGCTPLGEGVARRAVLTKAPIDGTDRSTDLRADDSQAVTDPATKSIIVEHGATIKRYATAYGFDWRLVMAIMRQESRFDHDAESHRGASGLMQVMPVTRREVADRLEIDDSTHPAANIRIGIYYLRKLYAMYEGVSDGDRLRLTLASYNAGPGRVSDAQEIATYLGDNPARWQAIRGALPLLSKRYTSLHHRVWSDGRPRNGFFKGAGETVAYVDSVMTFYDQYLHELQ